METYDDEVGESRTLVVAVAEIYDVGGDELYTWEVEVVSCDNKKVAVVVEGYK